MVCESNLCGALVKTAHTWGKENRGILLRLNPAPRGLSPIQQFTLRVDVRWYGGVPRRSRAADPTPIAAKPEGIYSHPVSARRGSEWGEAFRGERWEQQGRLQSRDQRREGGGRSLGTDWCGCAPRLPMCACGNLYCGAAGVRLARGFPLSARPRAVHLYGRPSVRSSICVAVPAPELPGCNPPSVTRPPRRVSAAERLPALAGGSRLPLAPVARGHKGRSQRCHNKPPVTGYRGDRRRSGQGSRLQRPPLLYGYVTFEMSVSGARR
ncbi:hypothetical protein EYF80_002858 [Liparis tanakae]|uniref:Uncharacterized protein n=1 Tax=Liparis tanakae TaxID=230148 RepID=A0A4Z2JBG1_9TELE|nr:hypothetical protein EYF80_002858 [Liparis tanakae]